MPADVTQFLSACAGVKSRMIAAAMVGVEKFGWWVVGEAAELAPVEFGTLKGSNTASKAEISGNEISVTIGFNTNYAVYVHENLTAHHDQGQAKFLEIAIRVNGPAFIPFVSKAINAVM